MAILQSSIINGRLTVTGGIKGTLDGIATNATNVALTSEGSGTNKITIHAGSGSTTFAIGGIDYATEAGKLTTNAGSEDSSLKRIRPIYFKNGVPTEFTTTIGTITTPVYLNAGTLTECSEFATKGHDHDGIYLPIKGKAADSDLLDSHDSAYYLDYDNLGNKLIIKDGNYAKIPTPLKLVNEEASIVFNLSGKYFPPNDGYYELCKLSSNSGGYGSCIITGRIGGWLATESDYVQILITNRAGIKIQGINIFGGSNKATWHNYMDIIASKDGKDDNDCKIYLHSHGYTIFDINMSLYGSGSKNLWTGTNLGTTVAAIKPDAATYFTSTNILKVSEGTVNFATNSTNAITSKQLVYDKEGKDTPFTTTENKPIRFLNGIPVEINTPLDASITGNATSADKAGKLTTNAGSEDIVYKTGNPTTEIDPLKSTIKPIYFKNGVPTEFTTTIGTITTPVYLNAGTLTACSEFATKKDFDLIYQYFKTDDDPDDNKVNKLNELLEIFNTWTEGHNVLDKVAGSYENYKNGTFALKAVNDKITLSSGDVIAKKLTANAGSGINPIYFSGGVPVASSSTIGTTTKPVYLNAGTLTECPNSFATADHSHTLTLSGDVTGSGSVSGTIKTTLNTVPISKGGTGGTTAAIGLHNLINGSTNESVPNDNYQIPASNGSSAVKYSFLETWNKYYKPKIESGLTMTGDILYSAKTNDIISPNSKSFYGNPLSKYLWHNLLAFDTYGKPKVEIKQNDVWYDKSDNEVLARNPFIEKENSATTIIQPQVVDKNGIVTQEQRDGTRWTWTQNMHCCNFEWLVVAFTWHGTEAKKHIKLERWTDADGNTKPESLCDLMYNGNSEPIWIKISNLSSDLNRLVLTIEKTDNAKSSASVTTIRLLTARKGDQGRGSEIEKPYKWDYHANLLPRHLGESSLGTSGAKWKDINSNYLHVASEAYMSSINASGNASIKGNLNANEILTNKVTVKNKATFEYNSTDGSLELTFS